VPIAWLSTRETCDELGISVRTLYRIIGQGKLPCYQRDRAYRLKVEDVERFRRAGDDAAGVREPRQPRRPLDSDSQALGRPDL
jgi:excisionase family DNA binding protein